MQKVRKVEECWSALSTLCFFILYCLNRSLKNETSAIIYTPSYYFNIAAQDGDLYYIYIKYYI